jgi:CheY-like chemotaxis protein/nitrogen-specific signal transduction histidine kinase
MVEERKRIDRELHQSQKQLQVAMEASDKANQAKSEFLSRMSHELRTPLNAILGFGQILDLDKELGANRKESVREILSAGNHLLELINDVLDLAKIEAGHIKVVNQNIYYHSILADAILIVSPLASHRNITIEYEPDIDENVFIHVDPVRLKEVILNLLSNAIKYNRKDGIIKVNCFKISDEFFRIEVIDNGDGLSEEKIQRLFQPFERLGAENSTIEGTGIGLVICKRIIEAMGGAIGVKSTVGKGSTFWIEVRLSKKLYEKQEGKFIDEQNNKFICEISDCKVLYVEDNPANIRLMEHIFKEHTNISLLSTMQPGEVLDLVKKHQPCLILMDINLSDMSGIDLIKQVRQSDYARDILVVAVSANAMPQDIEKIMAAGFDDYITKPVDIDQLIRLLSNLLQKSECCQSQDMVL